MSTALLVRSRKNGPIFLPDREYGAWIASAMSSLEQLAASLNVRSIDSLTYMEPEILQEMMEMVAAEKAEKFAKRLREQQEWHSPVDGLKTIEALLAATKNSANKDALIEDLEVVSKILSDLVKSDDSFRFEAA